MGEGRGPERRAETEEEAAKAKKNSVKSENEQGREIDVNRRGQGLRQNGMGVGGDRMSIPQGKFRARKRVKVCRETIPYETRQRYNWKLF